MCNACGFLCCAWDGMGECGCNSCGEVACMDTCPDCGGIIELTGCTCGDDEYPDDEPEHTSHDRWLGEPVPDQT